MKIAVAIIALGAAGCLFGVDRPGDESLPPNADPQAGCSLGCHGSDNSVAPPIGLSGSSLTDDVGIGAHQRHLDPAPTWHRVVACGDCHRVPEAIDSPGHMDDGDNKAELTFSEIAGPSAAWDGTNCTVGCHGSAAWGGKATQPLWTTVDGTQATCGSCHGVPPPPPHPADTKCASCHPTMEEGSLAFRDPASHINGKVDVVDPSQTGGCTTCHGSPDHSAPPKDLAGNSAPTDQGVGAHDAHFRSQTWHRAIACSSCHVVPLSVDAPGHRDGDNIAEVKFDNLNPAGVYTRATTTCSSSYCHSNGRGNTGSVSWVTPGALACTECHSMNGTGQSGKHRLHIADQNIKCSECHGTVIDANQTIIDAKLHVNGVHEIKMAAGTAKYDAKKHQCTNPGCHGSKNWLKGE